MWDHFPSDILLSIFYRLSVKEVIRFTLINKSFYQLIHSKFFVDAYNQQALLNGTNPPLILVSFILREKYSLHYESDNKELQECVPLPLPFRNPKNCAMVSYCNSLVCVYHHVCKEFILWNPYIQKALTLPKPSYIDDHSFFGFGFVNETSDYKVLMINQTNQAELYSLQHNCWKILANRAPFSTFIPHLICVKVHGLICVKGSLYWIATKADQTVMGVFDLKHEVFGEISLPDCWNAVKPSSLELTKHTDLSIAVVKGSRHNVNADIQVIDLTNEKKWKWRKYSSAEGSLWNGTMCLVHLNEKGETTVQREYARRIHTRPKQFIGFGNAYKYVNNLALLDKACEPSTPFKRRKAGESSPAA
ncbi:F-box protein At1g52495-like [Euphorbia lathyris]|uniref:F-box protein At1g52495-like n=1 Tax=Euphorbia lathyris TaxID=212925 RepID=UPI003313B952